MLWSNRHGALANIGDWRKSASRPHTGDIGLDEVVNAADDHEVGTVVAVFPTDDGKLDTPLTVGRVPPTSGALDPSFTISPATPDHTGTELWFIASPMAFFLLSMATYMPIQFSSGRYPIR
jgi:hypothetical protein